jgi:hypothetical protein
LTTSHPPVKTNRAFSVIFLFVLALSSCTYLAPIKPAEASVQPVRVTEVVTQVVTQDVTEEVTRIVEVPVTVTPMLGASPSAAPTVTPTLNGSPTPSLTPGPSPTPEPPQVSVLEYSDCLYGPASFFLYKTSLLAGSVMEAVGRNPEGTWLELQEVHGWNPCWIEAARVKFSRGDATDVPVVYPLLPYSNQFAPPDAIARRSGSEVTVSWKAVWMSFDDYRGYLIEAWVCQGGKQVYLPVNYVPPLEENTGTLSVKITDEPGCDAPAHARIYSADKYGYSAWQILFWPPAQ